jgi:hypothetical protein
MNLLVLPGAGDPYHDSSIQATNLLINYAKANKYNKIECISYPGHESYVDNANLELEINSTKQQIINALQKFEGYQEDFVVFVRSYGCNPYLDVLANHSLKLSFLKKSIVWGSSAFYLIYEGSTVLFNTFFTEGLKRGVRLSKNIFENTFPIESYVNMIVNHAVYFCSGSDDRYSPIHFYTYLKAINANEKNFFVPLIAGEKHTITLPNSAYEKLIFT